MDDNDNSTSGYGGSDTDTDSSYGGGYDGGYGGGDDDGNDDDGSDTGSYGNSNDDYGGYDDSNDNSSYSEADDGITADDISVSPYSSCEDTDDVFDTDLDQTFSAPAYGDTDGWYGSITEECEQAYDTVVDALESFVDTFSGKNNDTDTMPSELDTTDLPNNERNMDFSVADSFSDFKTRVAMDYEANIDNNVRHAQENATLVAMPFSIAAGELVGGQLHMGKEGMAVGVAAGVAAATGYGYITGKIGGTITTAFEAVEDVITGHDVDEKDDE